jgi:hypothetical protein
VIQLLLILDLGTRGVWAVSVTPRPRFIPRKGLPAPIVQEAGWARGKILCLCRGSNPGRPVRSQRQCSMVHQETDVGLYSHPLIFAYFLCDPCKLIPMTHHRVSEIFLNFSISSCCKPRIISLIIRHLLAYIYLSSSWSESSSSCDRGLLSTCTKAI